MLSLLHCSFVSQLSYSIHTDIEYRPTNENVGQRAGTNRGARQAIISSGERRRLRLLGIYRNYSSAHSEGCRQVCRAASRGEGSHHHWCVNDIMTPYLPHTFGLLAYKLHRRKLSSWNRSRRRLPVRREWAESAVHLRQGF